ncbi:MAG: hypothetical protein FIA96_04590 [Betaproteobacteria bacterium]|nr:hypothetical protein [Betaproteobacteria bacterium]
MSSIQVSKIDQAARKLRAEEMNRIEDLMLARLGLHFRQFSAGGLNALAVLAESVRPLFSWNPQADARPANGPGLLTRLSLAARALFSWNPQGRRS